MMPHKRTRDGFPKALCKPTVTPLKSSQPSRAPDDDDAGADDFTPTPRDIFDEPTPGTSQVLDARPVAVVETAPCEPAPEPPDDDAPDKAPAAEAPAAEAPAADKAPADKAPVSKRAPVSKKAPGDQLDPAGLCRVPARMLARVAGAGSDAAAALQALSRHLHTMADTPLDITPVQNAAKVAGSFVRHLMGPAICTVAASLEATDAADQARAAMRAAMHLGGVITPADLAEGLGHMPPGTSLLTLVAVCFEFLDWTDNLRRWPSGKRWRADDLLDRGLLEDYARIADLPPTPVPVEFATNLQVDDTGVVWCMTRAMCGLQPLAENIAIDLDTGVGRFHLLVFLRNVTVMDMRTRDDILAFVRLPRPRTRLLADDEEDALLDDGQCPALPVDPAYASLFQDALVYRGQRIY